MKFSKHFGYSLALGAILILVAAPIVFHFVWPGSGTEDIRNVILISIDTCRADYLGCYGFPGPITPNIDQLAEEGVVFSNAVSPVPITLPAHSTMLCGTIPPYHGVRNNIGYKLTEPNLTLAEIVREEGLATGAVVGSFVLDSQFGLNQGFDEYNDSFEEVIEAPFGNERRGEEVSRFAIEWLNTHKDDRFFLFLHYYDPHIEYDPPEPFSSQWADNPYAGEIAYTDYCIGQVIDELKKLKLYDSSLIIIVGDHGEMLGEHGEQTHAYFVYQSAVKVPMIFKLPGRSKQQKIDRLVGLVDIVPTVCGLLGLGSQAKFHGMDLSGYLMGRSKFEGDRHLYIESITAAVHFEANALLGVMTDRWKYIQTTRPELYDLIADPGEMNDLSQQETHRCRIFQDRLEQILQESAVEDNSESRIIMDEPALKRLQSLGYVASTESSNYEYDQNKADPKDLIEHYNDYMEFMLLLSRNEHVRAKELCEKLLLKEPQLAGTNLFAAVEAISQKNYARAVRYLRRLIELEYEPFRVNYNLAFCLNRLGEFDQAVEHYIEALRINPEAAKCHSELAGIFLYQKKYDKAVEHYGKALEIEPENINVMNILAWILATSSDEQLRDAGRAIVLGEKANSLSGNNQPEVLDTLAAAYASLGAFDKAITTAQKAFELAEESGKVALGERIRKRIELYEAGRPYRE
jgi:arylsulfatase A-like enzyme/Flp pilus assembly protein TadD